MKNLLLGTIIFIFFLYSRAIHGQEKANDPLHVSGVFPTLAMTADHYPRTEAGTGALMPWADRLWVITYVAHLSPTGSGTGLYEVDENMVLKKHPKSVVGTYANRLIHTQSMQLSIGPYLIDTLGNVRIIDEFKNHRLAATMTHLTDPENKLYYLAMEGEFFEVNVHSLEVKQLFQLMDELEAPQGSKPHFKSGFTNHGRVVVCNNSYNEKDFNGEWEAGRLAEWDGEGDWHIIEKKSDPYLMNGFDKKSIHLYHDADSPAQITIETDFMGNGDFQVYQNITVDPGAYVHFEFPEAYSAQWMRFSIDQSCNATAIINYN